MITGAAPRVRPRLKRLIYWSAFVPAEGKSLYDEVPPPYQDLFTAQADASGNNSVAMPLEVWQQAFMQDAGDEAQRIVHSLLVPHPMQYFTETVAAYDPAADGLAVAYVLSSDDVALPPASTAGHATPSASASIPCPLPAATRACSRSHRDSRTRCSTRWSAPGGNRLPRGGIPPVL